MNSPQTIPTQKRTRGATSKNSKEAYSLQPYSDLLAQLMKISPFVEIRHKHARGRPIEESVCDSEHAWQRYSPQMKEDLLRTIYWDMGKAISYLLSHRIPKDKIYVRPITYYPRVSDIPVIYVAIRNEESALLRFRNHINRGCNLHCYEELGEIPPLVEALSNRVFEGVPDLAPRRPAIKGESNNVSFYQGISCL